MSDDKKNTDDEDTIVTNIEDEKTLVIDDEVTEPSFDLNLHLGDNPVKKERMDPQKIRSVAGTFKVYSLRGGKSEEFVFEGLRKKDYTEAEIKAGFEDYLVLKESYVPSFFEKLKVRLRLALTNWLHKKK